MSTTTRQFAAIVRRRTSTFPCRMGVYFDCTAHGGGYYRAVGVPGAIVINSTTGTMLDLRSGEIYHDARFEAAKEAA